MAKSRGKNSHKTFVQAVFFVSSLMMILLLSYATVSSSFQTTSNASENCANQKSNLDRANSQVTQAEKSGDQQLIARAETNLKLKQRLFEQCTSVKPDGARIPVTPSPSIAKYLYTTYKINVANVATEKIIVDAVELAYSPDGVTVYPESRVVHGPIGIQPGEKKPVYTYICYLDTTYKWVDFAIYYHSSSNPDNPLKAYDEVRALDGTCKDFSQDILIEQEDLLADSNNVLSLSNRGASTLHLTSVRMNGTELLNDTEDILTNHSKSFKFKCQSKISNEKISPKFSVDYYMLSRLNLVQPMSKTFSGTCDRFNHFDLVPYSFQDPSPTEAETACVNGQAVTRSCGTNGFQTCTLRKDGQICRLLNCGLCQE